MLPEIALDGRLFNPEQLEFFGKVNFLKGGVAWSDAVSTVSRGYAQEIQTKELGFGLDTFLRKHGPITGILNGVDYSQWNPETDKHLERNYSSGDLSGKRECKRALLAEFGLPAGSLDRPIIGMVSRLTDQKGFDLIADVANSLMDQDITLIVLGSGDPKYEKMLRLLEEFHRDKVGALIGYDEALAHRIVAGADMFLVPSRYEPSGLTQMYSLSYGTVPVVRATGGLDEAIDEQTGFKFRDYSGVALLSTVQAALAAYRDQSRWTAMMRRGMQRDFSWNASAAKYLALYKRILES